MPISTSGTRLPILYINQWNTPSDPLQSSFNIYISRHPLMVSCPVHPNPSFNIYISRHQRLSLPNLILMATKYSQGVGVAQSVDPAHRHYCPLSTLFLTLTLAYEHGSAFGRVSLLVYFTTWVDLG